MSAVASPPDTQASRSEISGHVLERQQCVHKGTADRLLEGLVIIHQLRDSGLLLPHVLPVSAGTLRFLHAYAASSHH